MEIDVTLKNYRCFSDERPATIHLRPGFTSFIGPNNAGKSSLLKSFFEFRPLFEASKPEAGLLQGALAGKAQSFSHQPTTFDPTEIFSNSNSRDLSIEINLKELPPDSSPDIATIKKLTFRVPRNTNSWTATIHFDEERLRAGQVGVNNHGVVDGSRVIADLRPVYQALRDLTDTLYIGPFRNAVNIGSNDRYFDIETGQAFIGKWKFLKAGNFKDQNEACYRLTDEIREMREEPLVGQRNARYSVFVHWKSVHQRMTARFSSLWTDEASNSRKLAREWRNS
jgi:hypothetical protein